MSAPLLFTPIGLRDVTLKNRVVVSPMLQYRAVEGHGNDWHLVNAGRFVMGGAGLVMIESTKVERRGRGTTGDLGIWNDAHIPDHARLVDFIRENGAVSGLQISHSGRKARRTLPWEGGQPLEPADGLPSFDDWELVAPSAIPHSDKDPTPRALSTAEVQSMIDIWGQAARRAHEAGYDILEIHGGHGYLIHQFLSPVANLRNDQYGGSEEGRMRFTLELVEAVRANWPEDKPLFLRLSIEDDAGWGPDQNVALARLVKPLGVDVIDCSAGGIAGGSIEQMAPSYGYQVPYSQRLRQDSDIMTMAVGLIVHADQAEEILQRGQADLIAIGRELLYNPNWPMDAAQKLGIDDDFAALGGFFAHWLGKRAARMKDVTLSTFQNGIKDKQS